MDSIDPNSVPINPPEHRGTRHGENKFRKTNELYWIETHSQHPLTRGYPGKGRCRCVDPGAIVEEKFQHQYPIFKKREMRTQNNSESLVHINVCRKPKSTV
jgi:hypothetical protein